MSPALVIYEAHAIIQSTHSSRRAAWPFRAVPSPRPCMVRLGGLWIQCRCYFRGPSGAVWLQV